MSFLSFSFHHHPAIRVQSLTGMRDHPGFEMKEKKKKKLNLLVEAPSKL